MTWSRLLLTTTALALLSACAAERKPPTPVSAPPPPSPPPVQHAPPPPDWRDAPATGGSWLYRAEAAGAVASFGSGAADALLSLRCDRTAGAIALRRSGAASGPVPLTITTTSGARSFTATPENLAVPTLLLPIPARDPVLDAMAFSRGRFMVEVPGLPTLYLPAWPEVGRVIEDCR